ncbi:hypothetical protein Poli38472_013501 [Pythium oligandrum]|uniref:Ubiquitin-like modifier-activating enzyme 5 n=1 Tax=Pythium oligandrum TaxID=41045 RepID=A0A8K1C7L0_PYTOL|nr:hypothetical protein Poli38472_013501 [Pythium oligandrum]|eukprot:TMW58027.1 hypothetical protein Poli38472_013501 [Pythium oligandrum]
MSHQHDTFHDDGPPIVQLQAAVKALDEYVHHVVPPSSVPTPPPQPPPSTPSRLSPIQLFARQEFVNARWKDLSKAHIAVCGLGGIGALAAESLVRAGVGRIFLVDHARVDLSALAEMTFRPEDVGCSRTQALRLRLRSLNASTDVDSFTADFTNTWDLRELRKKLKISSVVQPSQTPSTPGDASSFGLFEALTQKRPYDALLCCVDSEEAQLALNQICLELSLPLLVASLSPCNTRISVRMVLPGHTCCLECIQCAEKDRGDTVDTHVMDEVAKSLARAFPASLPHVELLAGGLLAQSTLRFLLEVGDVVPFIAMNVLTMEMDSFSFPPHPACRNEICNQRQAELRPPQ